MRRFGKVVRRVVAVTAAASSASFALAACGPGGDTTAASATTSSSSTVTTPATGSDSSSSSAYPHDVSDYASQCSADQNMPTASAYSGTGTHPIAIFLQAGAGDWSGSGVLPTDLHDALGPWFPRDAQAVQLVACITMASGPVIEDCGRFGDSQGPDVILARGDYTISLRQANTGAEVTAPIHLPGNQSSTCPKIADIPSGTTTTYTLHTDLSGEQVRQALAQFLGPGTSS